MTVTTHDIKTYVTEHQAEVEFGGMSESLAKMVNYFIESDLTKQGGENNDD